jgi:hypothetical protein
MSDTDKDTMAIPKPEDFNIPLTHLYGDSDKQKAYSIYVHQVCVCGFQRMAHVGNVGANVIEGVNCTVFTLTGE